ncbi:hypothetical protein BT93_E1872 [Corymbia citriodora subsp. variegata]|nr:hypothetical protein BT93_E1872 [Corymbia citriodora subsp. variegata]
MWLYILMLVEWRNNFGRERYKLPMEHIEDEGASEERDARTQRHSPQTPNSIDATFSITTAHLPYDTAELRRNGQKQSPWRTDGDGDRPAEATGYHRRPKPWKVAT